MSDPKQLSKPDEIFDGDKLPEDLKWIMSHFGLPKDDPLVVLMAWHWHRVQQNHDVILAGTMQLKAFLDPQIKKIGEFCDAIEKVQPSLGRIVEALALDEKAVQQKLHDRLHEPVNQITTQLQKIVSDLTREWDRAIWQKCLACYVAGVSTGAVFVLCVFLSHS
jgi:hypothetical protein